jgi:HKD family nuclease
MLRNDKQDISRSIISNLVAAKEAYFCIAFLRDSGLSLLKDQILKAAKRDCSLTFYVGTDFYQTEPVALRYLFELTKKNQKIKLFLLSRQAITFHPKIYLLLGRNEATAIIGSSNLTRGGLIDNIEASTCIKTSCNDDFIIQIRDFFHSIEESKRSKPADPVEISKYEREFVTYRNHIKRAEKEAAAEIADLFNGLNAAMLRKYREEYLSDEQQQSVWTQRKSDYKKARDVLDNLDFKHIDSKKAFLDEYEKLVGKAGQRGLRWTPLVGQFAG